MVETGRSSAQAASSGVHHAGEDAGPAGWRAARRCRHCCSGCRRGYDRRSVRYCQHAARDLVRRLSAALSAPPATAAGGAGSMVTSARVACATWQAGDPFPEHPVLSRGQGEHHRATCSASSGVSLGVPRCTLTEKDVPNYPKTKSCPKLVRQAGHQSVKGHHLKAFAGFRSSRRCQAGQRSSTGFKLRRS